MNGGDTDDEKDFGRTATVCSVEDFDVIVEVSIGWCDGGGRGGWGRCLSSNVAIRHRCGGA